MKDFELEVRESYVIALQSFVNAVIFLAIGVYILRFDGHLPNILSLICFVFFVALLQVSISNVLNPQYQARKRLDKDKEE